MLSASAVGMTVDMERLVLFSGLCLYLLGRAARCIF